MSKSHYAYMISTIFSFCCERVGIEIGSARRLLAIGSNRCLAVTRSSGSPALIVKQSNLFPLNFIDLYSFGWPLWSNDLTKMNWGGSENAHMYLIFIFFVVNKN